MHFDWWTFALQTVNFAVLVWLLQRFLYRPVLRVIAARRAEIEKARKDAADARAAADAKAAAAVEERNRIAAERDTVLKNAVAQADQLTAARRAQATHDASALLEDAHRKIAAERGAALAEARRVALGLGCDIARRLLDDIPVGVRSEAWLERVERHLAGLPEDERRRLTVKLADGVSLRVITATPLPPEAAKSWQTRLRRALGDGLAVQFDVDAALVAGVELHFPSGILSYSWQSTIAALRAEVEPREAAPRGDAR